jgi:outer membrane protein assembly factor BamB
MINARPAALRLLLGLVWTAALAVPAAADNWPRFRGPNGTGTADDKTIPVEWGPRNILWKIEVPGRGNSSPIVWGDALFLQSASEDGKERWLICIDALSGKLRWKEAVPGAVAPIHKFNSLASSTPATDGERVYCAFWDGANYHLYAYDFTGKLIWTRDLGGYTSQHGAGHSPIVHDGKVIFANDQDGTSTLIALDARTGKNVWQVPRKPFRACYSTPFILERPNRPAELIVVSTAGVSGYNPQTGGENWVWNWNFVGMALRTVASPVAGLGLIFVNSGDGSGARHSIAVKVGDKGDVTATNLAWEKKRDMPYVPGMLLSGNYLFSTNDRGLASCQDAKTGEVLWYERLGGDITASPVLIDGKIYTANKDGQVFVLAAQPTFQLLAKNELHEEIVASPAVANGRLYIRGNRHLFCIGQPQ